MFILLKHKVLIPVFFSVLYLITKMAYVESAWLYYILDHSIYSQLSFSGISSLPLLFPVCPFYVISSFHNYTLKVITRYYFTEFKLCCFSAFHSNVHWMVLNIPWNLQFMHHVPIKNISFLLKDHYTVPLNTLSVLWKKI